MKIKDILTIKEFEPVVDLTWGLNINEHEKMLAKYIMTDEIAETFVEVLESFNMVRSKNRIEKLSGDVNDTVKRAHILSGQYGTGKSYFLLMLSIILEMKNSVLANKMIEQFKNYPELQYQLKYIQDNKRYFVVRINGESENQKEFLEVIQSKVLETIEKEFGEIKFNYVYSKAKELLEKLYDVYDEKIDRYLEKIDTDMDDLLASLSNYRSEGLEIGKELLNGELGLEIKLTQENFNDFFTEVNKKLRDNGYDELVIIFDEFSAYITASIEDKRINKDLGQIQTLCQLTSRNSQMNIGLIASLHKDINDILQSYGVGSTNELDKIMGRFQSHILKFEQGNELIKNTLNLDRYSFKEYKEKYGEFIQRLEKRYPYKFEDFYPIHPTTLDYLVPISEIYAQKTRTTLGFIKEIVKEKFFSKPVEENGKLNLVTLSDLFETFEDAIENKKPEIIDIYHQSINGYSSDDDIIKYIRAITIAYSSSLTKTNTKSELTAEDIVDIYQEKNADVVRESLSRAVNTNYSYVMINKGAYRLIAGTGVGGVQLDKKISEYMANISATNVMRNILEKSESRIFIKKNYSLKYNFGLLPFDVTLEGTKINIKELMTTRIESLVKCYGYGKIIFLIPDFYEKYNRDELVREYAEKLKGVDKNICIAFINENPFKEEELKEYGALLKMEKTDKESLANGELAKIIITRRRKLEDKIRNKYLRKFANLRNFTFVFGGGKIENTIRVERNLYSELIFNHYNKFPREIKVENYNTRAGINDVIKMSSDRGTGEFDKNGTSSGIKQLKMLLKPLDLIEFTEGVSNYKFQLKLPSENASANSKEIMGIILNEKIELADKYSILQSAPYGLSDKLVDLYIFVANKVGKIAIVLKNNEKKKDIYLDEKMMKTISENPQNYEFLLNKEMMIPKEVENVWRALASLKIVKQSRSKDFKADSSNDFRPFPTLGSEINTILENLEEKDSRLRQQNIKTKELKKLVDRLKDISTTYKSDEFFDKVANLPSIMGQNKSFSENIVAFEELMTKIKGIKTKNLPLFEKANLLVPQLADKIEELNGYGDFKGQLKEIEMLLTKYKQNFYETELIEEIDKKLTELLSRYNNEYKARHDTYNEKFIQCKKEFLDEMGIKLQAIKHLKSLNFKNISSVDKFVSRLEDFYPCDLQIVDGNILTCKFCDKRNLKQLESKKDEIEELFIKHKKIVNGIFESYGESLRKDSLKEKFINNDEYKNLIFALNRISNEDIKGNEVEEISQAVESIENEVNTALNEEVLVEKNVDFNEITDELLLELQGTGQKYMSLDELKQRFDNIIEKYKANAIKSTKI